ncbi:DUF3618 domain-containing protein [Streptomyces sp. AJS327]|uniref:DUF3618 domain-containing protein n=1 Tax=Streptomyces sp. AJS327 TaxID=2545265 RepID=UPI0015DDCF6D|nr:DUF3618 domain-containing protein [Streptomyces sp. AJS327]MBA0049629.1 DUF3618 domain-containing protein [Streptomyces sp. AJS327]
MPEARTPAQIEADIVRRRRELAAALDEIAIRVHPQTLIGDAKARVAAAVDRTAGRACEAAHRAVYDARSRFVDETGAPRLERVVPAAVAVAVVVGGVCAVKARRRRG